MQTARGTYKEYAFFMYFDKMILCPVSGGLASMPFPQDRYSAATGTYLTFQDRIYLLALNSDYQAGQPLHLYAQTSAKHFTFAKPSNPGYLNPISLLPVHMRT